METVTVPDIGLKKLKRKSKRMKTVRMIVSYFFLIAFSLFFLFPFFYMLTRSFMTYEEVTEVPLLLFPRTLTWENFAEFFSLENNYFVYLKNTAIIIGVNLIAIPLASSFCAFGFSRCDFKGKETIFMILFSTVMLPGAVTQVPMFVFYARLNMVNTLFPFTVPAIFGGGVMNIFMIRQFMKSIPKEIDDSAEIDGANPFYVYFCIILPLLKPVLIMIMVGVFSGYWNDFMGPLIYLRTPDKYTLGLGFYKYFQTAAMKYHVEKQMAIGVIMTIFPAVVFLVFQKSIIEGIVITGSIKG